jgi:UDP-galactopyranose mutase
MKIVIVGAGLSGCVLAERFASEGHQVVIYEKRPHIGGNCYDYVDEAGILVAKYGPHFFHTNSEEVWAYVNRFSEWKDYKHRTIGFYRGKYFPIPVNIETVNTLLGQNIQTEEEMRAFMKTIQIEKEVPENSEDVALSRVGRDLYEIIFRGYTKKQWEKEPRELDPSVLARIPIRYNHDDTYFSDKYQAMPAHGYTKMCSAMLANPLIEVRLGVDYERPEVLPEDTKVFYTGRIDAYFAATGLPALEYRSLEFQFETLDMKEFQKGTLVNYPDSEVSWTRICEYKHILNQVSDKTTIVKEFPRTEGEPYYPVPSPRNLELYERYKVLAEEEEKRGVYFVGRLANYKYFNMDQAIENALTIWKRLASSFHSSLPSKTVA